MKLSFFKNLFLTALIISMAVILKSPPATADGTILDYNTINYTPAITKDNTSNTVIYVGTNNTSSNYMYYYYDNRTQKDNISIDQLSAPPVVDSDGTVYFCDSDNISAYYDNGSKKWNISYNNIPTCSLTLSLDNKTLYYIDNKSDDSGNYAYTLEAAYTDNGSIKYSYNIGDEFNSMVVGPDGTVYIQGGKNVYAVEDNGAGFRQKWEVQTSNPPQGSSSLSIGPDGTIYAPTYDETNYYSILYAIRPDGSVKWTLNKLLGEPDSATAVIDRYGNIYVSTLGYLYKISDNGTILDNVILSLDSGEAVPPVLVDEGKYICQRYNYQYIYCYDTNNLSSSLIDINIRFFDTSPQVFDGKMYVATSIGLYIFDNSTVFNLDTSAPWPSFLHDSQNTAHLILHNMAFPKDPTNNDSEVYITSIAPDFPGNTITSSTIYTPQQAEDDGIIDLSNKPENIGSISKVIATNITLDNSTDNVSSTRIQVVGLTLPLNPLFYKYVNGQWINLDNNTACDNCNFSLIKEDNGKYTISFTIKDGGPLDSDGNIGTIKDPLVIAETPTSSINTTPASSSEVSSGGCTTSNTSSVGLIFILLVGLGFGIRKKLQKN